ncbi:MAG: carbohydrate ABC transporter permease [Chloroflexi bacterium]|nr:carbohydrate ABC transporter permease [Chloroflexota bacterium]MCC6892308.1 carbohydrate ABC transporter permease [Anaerolineae bacterium]
MVRSPREKWLDTLTTHTTLLIIGLVFIFPVFYTLMTSFKSKGEVLTKPPTIIPSTFSLEGYDTVINESAMVRTYLPNTFINSFFSSLLVVPLAGLAAYTFSRYRFRGSRTLEILILSLMMIPRLTNLLPLYQMASDADLLNTHTLMVAVYTAGGIPFSIWIVKAFFDAIPVEMEEAALIDGCTPFGALWRVVVPLALPGLFAAFLLNFVDTWNEFLFAVVLAIGNKTATVGLYDFQSSFETAYHVWAAAAIIILIPVLAVFLALRNVFFRAMLDGALRG